MSLTHRELACLKAIDELTVDGVSPSYAEIATRLGLASKSNIHRLVCQLERDGFIGYARDARGWRGDRGLSLTPKAEAWLVGRRDLSRLTDDQIKQLARELQAEIRRRTPRAVA